MKVMLHLTSGARRLLSDVAAVFYFILASSLTLAMPVSKPTPIIGPDVISFGSLQPVTVIYHPLAIVQPQIGLPAPEGSIFEGPDPGLNANIIGGTDCPNNYRKDRAGICRLEFVVYGPHPFSAIIPKTFKGSLQFYMGLQVGNYNPFPRRRPSHRLRGRQRQRGNRKLSRNNNKNNSNNNSNVDEQQNENSEKTKEESTQQENQQNEQTNQQESEQSKQDPQQQTTPSSDDDDD